MNNFILLAINASLEAGNEILKVYNTKFDVETKSDDSPLTLADRNAHNTISKYLEKTPFPILSEEGNHTDFEVRKNWKTLWIVDPLDGTKEFVKRNDEFTVNIALVENGKPIVGIIYIPVEETIYFSSIELGAYKASVPPSKKFNSLEDIITISSKLPLEKNERKYTVVASRTHMSEQTRNYISNIEKYRGEIELISRGSSLKFCTIAEGLADEYPRFAPTMEWDTAAGNAILNSVGFGIFKTDENEQLDYNKEDLLNPNFVVRRYSTK